MTRMVHDRKEEEERRKNPLNRGSVNVVFRKLDLDQTSMAHTRNRTQM